jgi:4-hydroxythreonine-4-phosphate dehydrogenase
MDIPVIGIDEPARAASIFAHALPVLPLILPAPVIPGVLDERNGGAVGAAIELAVRLTLTGDAAAVVTNPIHKKTFQEAGFSYPGHTEFLAVLSGCETEPVMMLAGEGLRVVPVTRHVSLRQAVERLSPELITETGGITAAALADDFGIEVPRIAVAGLNPHAGEGGTMGTEELDVIQPAIEALRRRGMEVRGPLPPDTLFHEEARRTYDAVLCMYHDQALIPIKTVDFHGAVNVTLGLPFVRTSPDHGTALNIAGSGKARADSLIAALGLAAHMAGRRASARAG